MAVRLTPSTAILTRRSPPALIGVVHLLPLPGAPNGSPGLWAVLERARADADALVAGGVDGIIVENLGDAPFHAGRVCAATVAGLTRAALVVRDRAPGTLLGVNVLRNDALAALGIASAVGADFIRVNVHVGAMVTDQGVITGRARETLLERRRLAVPAAIAADVLVKHAVPLGDTLLEDAARDTLHRGRADALIVTGRGTGQRTASGDLERVRRACPEAVLWVGSGVTPDNAHEVAAVVDGAIVGTWLHADGELTAPVDPERVRRVRAALDQAANIES